MAVSMFPGLEDQLVDQASSELKKAPIVPNGFAGQLRQNDMDKAGNYIQLNQNVANASNGNTENLRQAYVDYWNKFTNNSPMPMDIAETINTSHTQGDYLGALMAVKSGSNNYNQMKKTADENGFWGTLGSGIKNAWDNQSIDIAKGQNAVPQSLPYQYGNINPMLPPVTNEVLESARPSPEEQLKADQIQQAYRTTHGLAPNFVMENLQMAASPSGLIAAELSPLAGKAVEGVAGLLPQYMLGRYGGKLATNMAKGATDLGAFTNIESMAREGKPASVEDTLLAAGLGGLLGPLASKATYKMSGAKPTVEPYIRQELPKPSNEIKVETAPDGNIKFPTELAKNASIPDEVARSQETTLPITKRILKLQNGNVDAALEAVEKSNGWTVDTPVEVKQKNILYQDLMREKSAVEQQNKIKMAEQTKPELKLEEGVMPEQPKPYDKPPELKYIPPGQEPIKSQVVPEQNNLKLSRVEEIPIQENKPVAESPVVKENLTPEKMEVPATNKESLTVENAVKPEENKIAVDTTPEGVEGRSDTEDVFYRYSQSADTPDNGAGYTLWAKNKSQVENGYGKHGWQLKPQKTISSDEFEPVVNKALKDDYRNGVLSKDLDDLIENISSTEGIRTEEAIDKLTSEMHPSGIVDSAGFFDNQDLMSWMWDRFEDKLKDTTIKTNDGAVSFTHPTEATRIRSGVDVSIDGVEGRMSTDMPITKTGTAVEGEILKPFEIRRELQTKYNVPIRQGGVVAKGASAEYKTGPESISTRSQNDLVDITHELAHHVQKTDMGWNGYVTPYAIEPYEGELAKIGKTMYPHITNQGKLAKEGFSVFMERRSFGKPSPEAPKFSHYFENTFMKSNPKAEVIDWTRDNIKRLYSQPKWDIYKSEFARGNERNVQKPLNERVKDGLTSLSSETWDPNSVVKRFTDDAEAKGVKVDLWKHPYHFKRAFQNKAAALAGNWMDEAQYAIDDTVHPIEGKKSLKQILSPIKDKEDFFMYAAAKREIQDAESLGHFANMNGLTLDDLKQITMEREAKLPEYLPKAKEITELLNNWGKYIAKIAGMPDDEAAKIFSKQFYVPLNKLIEKDVAIGGAGVNGGSPFKKYTGKSTRAKIAPEESIVENMLRQIEWALDQKMKNDVIDMAEKAGGMGKWLERVSMTKAEKESLLSRVSKQLEEDGIDNPTESAKQFVSSNIGSDLKNGIMTIYKNGELQSFRVHPSLYDALYLNAALKEKTPVKDLLFKLLGKMPADAQRMGFTQLQPEWSVFNPIRDIPNSVFLSNHPFRMLYTLPKILPEFIRKGQLSQIRKIVGGEAVEFLTQGSKVNAKDVMPELTASWLSNKFNHPIRSIAKALGATEKYPRTAAMDVELKVAGWKKGKWPTLDQTVKAANAYNDATLPFGDYGKLVKEANAYTPFLGANILDVRMHLKAMKHHPVSYLTIGASLMTLPTLKYWWDHKDDPEWIEMPTWKKTNFLRIYAPGLGRYIPLPVTPVVSSIFIAGPLAAAEAIYRKDADHMALFMQGLKNLVPNVIPVIPKLAYEVATNQNLQTGKKLYPSSKYTNERPKDQYNPWNTETSKVIGDVFNVSPAKVEHVIYGMTGGLATQGIRLAEAAGRATGAIEESPDHKTSSADYPFIRRLTERKSVGPQAESLSQFFDRWDELQQAYGSNKRGKSKLTPKEYVDYHRFKGAAERINDMRKITYKTTDDVRRDRIWLRIINTARSAMGEKQHSEK